MQELDAKRDFESAMKATSPDYYGQKSEASRDEAHKASERKPTKLTMFSAEKPAA